MKKLVMLGIAVLLSLAGAQDLRAWLDLNFGDDPVTVQAKMESAQADGRISPSTLWGTQTYSKIARFAENSSYPLSLAGVDMSLSFDFNDSKLYRLRFDTHGVSASYWDSEIQPNYSTVRQVLVTALGRPTSSRALEYFDTQAGFIKWGDIWASNGVTRSLGIYETTGFTYGVELWIEWDWMVAFIAANTAQVQQDAVQDAAGGF